MENKFVSISCLHGHHRNYRKHPQLQLAKLIESIKRFQQVRSIVVAPESNGQYTILAGHGIVAAAEQCGLTEMRCDIVPSEWTEAERNAYLVADNLHTQGAIDDDLILAELLEEQRAAGHDLASVGFSDQELDTLLERLGTEVLESSPPDDEDLLKITENSSTVESLKQLKFGKYVIQMTDEEYTALTERLDEYVAETGSHFGFVGALLHV